MPAVAFTSRYGPHTPSALRICRGPCEGMGCHPQEVAGVPPTASVDDRWEFVRCAACGGSGRVPWWRSVLRVPRWFLRAVRFFWQEGVRQVHGNGGWSYWRWMGTVARIAFLADLGWRD